ncbi:MAG: GAF domain-containing protein, partial [Solirubrobacteraceae bacterium]|nr:GAF domain-containing protein [Solirubrobacteraceae bacterium]
MSEVRAPERMSAEDWAEAEFGPNRDAVLAAFAGIAAALSEGTSLDALLGLIVAQVCELTGVSRCAVYLLDEKTGTFPGHAGCQHGVDIGPGVRRSVAGLEADGFAREIVQTRAPVFVSDAALDPRPVRSAMRAWDVRAMLGVPMVLAGEVIGILYLDNEQQPHPFSRATRDISVAFADLAAMAIAQA